MTDKPLTANDPEPDIGSVVINRYQDYLRRGPTGSWGTLPESRAFPFKQWPEVAGEGNGGEGPVRVVKSFVSLPEQLELGEVIARLERADQTKVLPVGFAAPHSTFEGWKGGDYTMKEHTDCWLVQAEGISMGETLGALLLELLLGAGSETPQ